jgi:hypothetical protein
MGGLLEIPGAEHASVVGEGKGRHLVSCRPAYEIGEAVGPIQERKFGMGMEMNERHGPERPKG